MEAKVKDTEAHNQTTHDQEVSIMITISVSHGAHKTCIDAQDGYKCFIAQANPKTLVLCKETVPTKYIVREYARSLQQRDIGRGFFMAPSARSGYLCIAPDWKTERQRSKVCKEGAVQIYPYLTRGDLNAISFLVEVDSV